MKQTVKNKTSVNGYIKQILTVINSNLSPKDFSRTQKELIKIIKEIQQAAQPVGYTVKPLDCPVVILEWCVSEDWGNEATPRRIAERAVAEFNGYLDPIVTVLKPDGSHEAVDLAGPVD
jgi:hypothetical protein